LIATAIPVISIGGRMGSGWFGDRFDKRKVAAVCTISTLLGLLLLSQLSNETMWMVVPFIIFFCVGYGGNNTLRGSFLVEYFGRRKLGSIFGFMMGLAALGGLIGPTFAGWIFDILGSYHMVWLVYAALSFIALIIISTMPAANTCMKPEEKVQP